MLRFLGCLYMKVLLIETRRTKLEMTGMFQIPRTLLIFFTSKIHLKPLCGDDCYIAASLFLWSSSPSSLLHHPMHFHTSWQAQKSAHGGWFSYNHISACHMYNGASPPQEHRSSFSNSCGPRGTSSGTVVSVSDLKWISVPAISSWSMCMWVCLKMCTSNTVIKRTLG